MNNIFLSFLVLIAVSCTMAQRQPEEELAITNTKLVPAAQGEVDTKTDKNGNTVVSVKVKHLAPPERLSPGATGYVVWVRPTGMQKFKNIGTLQVNKNLEGQYETKIPYKDFVLKVTPESSTTVQSPNKMTVLQKQVTI